MLRIQEKLLEAGYSEDLVRDMLNLRVAAPSTFDILVAALPEADDPLDLEVTARMLTGKWAKAANGAMVDVFEPAARRHEPLWQSAAWAVGNAIDANWSDARFDDLARMVTDPSLGRGRQMIVYGMRKSKRAEAGPIAASLLTDPDVRLHALSVLMKHPVESARSELMAMSEEKGIIGRKARKALANLDAREKE